MVQRSNQMTRHGIRSDGDGSYYGAFSQGGFLMASEQRNSRHRQWPETDAAQHDAPMLYCHREGKNLATHEYSYTVLFEPAEEGGYVVTCLALPGLVTEADTLEEARAMAADAIRGYLESLAKDRLHFPPEPP